MKGVLCSLTLPARRQKCSCIHPVIFVPMKYYKQCTYIFRKYSCYQLHCLQVKQVIIHYAIKWCNDYLAIVCKKNYILRMFLFCSFVVVVVVLLLLFFVFVYYGGVVSQRDVRDIFVLNKMY